MGLIKRTWRLWTVGGLVVVGALALIASGGEHSFLSEKAITAQFKVIQDRIDAWQIQQKLEVERLARVTAEQKGSRAEKSADSWFQADMMVPFKTPEVKQAAVETKPIVEAKQQVIKPPPPRVTCRSIGLDYNPSGKGCIPKPQPQTHTYEKDDLP